MDNDGITDDTDDDIDGDNISNTDETTYGSDPRDPNSKPHNATYPPITGTLNKLSTAPYISIAQFSSAVTNRSTFPAGTYLSFTGGQSALNTLQSTTGIKIIPLAVNYPDGSSTLVHIRLTITTPTSSSSSSSSSGG